MPQPLSKVKAKASLSLGNIPDRPLARHPDLALLAMEALASWSNVEGFMLGLFCELLGGNDDLATEIFLALEVQSAKTAAIMAAATKRLENEPDNLRILNALLAIAKTNQKARDKLAHWQWGDSPDLPDALLLVNPKVALKKIKSPDIKEFLNEIFVYRERDFTDIIQANNRLCGFAFKLKFILLNHPANIEGKVFDELWNEPEIQDRVNRQA